MSRTYKCISVTVATTRLTSEQWLIRLYPNKVILDPDGWDRTNLDYSFGKELICRETFEQRLLESTVQIHLPLG